MATSFPLRPFTLDEIPAFLAVHQHAFHHGPASEASRARMLSRLEFDRTLAAFDGATMVGTSGVFSFRMRVPGALIPVAGVSMVAVLPTHRRRGILSALMRAEFADIRDRGETVAALFASEAGIYQRYGYGRASWHAFYRIRGGEGGLAGYAPTDAGLRLRLAEPREARTELGKVYELALAERPGLYARNDAWWDRALAGPDDGAPGATPLRCLLAEDDSGPRGYALFTATAKWDDPTLLPDSSMDIGEVVAADPAALVAIWGDLLGRDLVTEFTAGLQPVDDPLQHLLADPRKLRSRISDGLWVRLVDVGGALAQRRYSAPVDVVVEVTGDEWCPQNQGRWHLATTSQPGTPEPGTPQPGAPQPGSPGGLAATCERTTAAPDLTLPVYALGAAYLGGGPLGPLARAGLIAERRPGAVAALSTAMSWEPAPWCPMIF